jgi:hypothetical protein
MLNPALGWGYGPIRYPVKKGLGAGFELHFGAGFEFGDINIQALSKPKKLVYSVKRYCKPFPDVIMLIFPVLCVVQSS